MSFREDQMKRNRKLFKEDGNILIGSVIIVALLVATGLGYMKWATDERWDTAYEEATVQAYFLAQAGVIERGLLYLRTRTPGELPTGTVYLKPGYIKDVGLYFKTIVRRVTTMGSGDIFQRTDTYDIFSTGRAEFTNHQLGNRFAGQPVEVERTAKMRARLRSFANYMYLTNFEVTNYNEIIWFWSYDSLWGRVHSNDFIGIKYSPHFYGPISTCQSRFVYYEPDPYFAYPPQFEVPPVLFPRQAETLRSAARWITDGGGRFMTRVWLRGEGGIDTYQYELGSEPPPLYGVLDEMFNNRHFPQPYWDALFVDGQAEIYGEMAGNLTIGTAGTMWLVDNVKYVDSDPLSGQFEDWSTARHMLGLISEKDIIIQNNEYNGRENGIQYLGNHNRHSIIINAGMVALDESFTFQHQNDDWEAYQGPSPDERGIIHLFGAVTQWRRGYVHRSNHDGTGYGKDYRYDFRFDTRPPPFYMEAMDEDGHGLFDIISWGELSPDE